MKLYQKIKNLFRYILFPIYVYKSYISLRNVENHIFKGHQKKFLLKNAVIVKMAGGLTNQMICYMAGRLLADIKKATLIIDTTFYTNTKEGQTSRNLQITNYGIRYDIIIPDSETINFIKSQNNITIYSKGKLKLLNNDIERIKNEVLLHDSVEVNIWASLDIREAATDYAKNNNIFEELTLDYKTFFKNVDYEFLNQIKNSKNPVAIHVRRGDFLTNEGGQSVTLDFYINAINDIESKLSAGAFFVFSDDIDWCKKHLKSEFPIHFADFNDDQNGFKDMYLASQCQHFILTQASTFGHQIVLLSKEHEGRIIIRSSENDKLRNQS
ncbi:alpha-1,2-fucosyltransferase [Paucihalobacter ruber]|uniref:Alpha-1,2-fucosyltransferase n=1 Tax=Paucihalobacter ruber TaxID=2567861 RepID=A0A506PRD3_9FLAO|nr:alpha-1,2-fucosyltransferase [Paucihalobacter ruber]TPV35755.1 alpha-1,2-fucosyltransferase [Paucihalobacter ruber]